MDPANFKPEDIFTAACPRCGTDVEFWKDDVRLACPGCKTMLYNPRLGNTCLAWCKQAARCIGNSDIDEWKKSKAASCDNASAKGGRKP